MKFAIFSCILLSCFLNLRAVDVQDLEEIVRGNPFSLGEEEFKLKFAEKYSISGSWEHWGSSAKNAKIFGFKAERVTFRFFDKKLSSIFLYLNDFKNPSYEAKVASNVQIINDLKKAYGEPSTKSILSDMSIYLFWKNVKGMDIKYRARILQDSMGDTKTTLEFTRPELNFIRYDPDFTLRKDYVNTIRGSIHFSLMDERPESKDLDAIVAKLSNFNPPRHVVNNSFKVHYGQSFFMSDFELNPLDILQSPAMRYSLKKVQKPKSSYYSKIYSKDSKVLFMENINERAGQETIRQTISLNYQDEFLKVITSEGENYSEKFWLDYDERGYLSRIVRVKNGLFNNIYYIYAEKNYDNYVVAQYHQPTDSARSFKIRNGGYSIKYQPASSYSSGAMYFTKETYSVKQFFSFYQINGWKSYIPMIENDKFKPKSSVDSSFLKPNLELFEKVVEHNLNSNVQVQKNARKILEDKNPFKHLSEKFITFVKEESAVLPFTINRVAKTAVQLKLKNGKLFTLFKNKAVLGYLHLVEITDKGAEFKNVNSGKTFFMNIGETKTLEKSFIVNYQGTNHKLVNGDNFMNNKFLVEKDKYGFVSDGKLVKAASAICELPVIHENAGNHRVNECKCLDDPVDKDFFNLTPKDIKVASTAKINDQYLFKFCTFEIMDISVVTRDGSDSRNYSELGIFAPVGNEVKQLYAGRNESDLKITSRMGGLRVNGKKIELETDYSGTEMFSVSLGKSRHVNVGCIPNNPWTLKRLIKYFETYINSSSYKFSDNTVREDNKYRPFKYSINPEKNEMELDGNLYKLSFIPGKIILTAMDGGTSTTLRYRHLHYFPQTR